MQGTVETAPRTQDQANPSVSKPSETEVKNKHDGPASHAFTSDIIQQQTAADQIRADATTTNGQTNNGNNDDSERRRDDRPKEATAAIMQAEEMATRTPIPTEIDDLDEQDSRHDCEPSSTQLETLPRPTQRRIRGKQGANTGQEKGSPEGERAGDSPDTFVLMAIKGHTPKRTRVDQHSIRDIANDTRRDSKSSSSKDTTRL